MFYLREKFRYFRKRFFVLRLIILLIILVFLLAFSSNRLIFSLTNIAIDAISMAGIPTVAFARDYRKLEVLELEKKILMGYNRDNDKILSAGEREKFTADTGLLLFKRGQTFHIKVTEKEIVDLANRLGYGEKSYQQMTRECFEKASDEGKELYSLSMDELNKGKKHLSLYTKAENWKWGFTQNSKYLLAMPRLIEDYWTRKISFSPLLELYKHAFSGLTAVSKDFRRGVVIKKIKGEPGYYVR